MTSGPPAPLRRHVSLLPHPPHRRRSRRGGHRALGRERRRGLHRRHLRRRHRPAAQRHGPRRDRHPRGHRPRRRRAHRRPRSRALGRAPGPDLGRPHRVRRPRHRQGDAQVRRRRHDAVDPNAALTFAVAPDGASARIITAGRDVIVNLATGAATNGTGLTFAAGDAHAGAQAAPSLDYAADGRPDRRRRGQSAYAVQTAAGAATLSTLAGVPFPTLEPLRSTVASDGSVWTAANLTDKPNRPAQSRLVRYDPATGNGPRSERVPRLQARCPDRRRSGGRRQDGARRDVHGQGPAPSRSSAASTPTGPACGSRPTRAARPLPRSASTARSSAWAS